MKQGVTYKATMNLRMRAATRDELLDSYTPTIPSDEPRNAPVQRAPHGYILEQRWYGDDGTNSWIPIAFEIKDEHKTD